MDLGQRINIIGCSGSGKSTLAKALAAKLDLDFIELDSFQHRENWRQSSREEFLGYVHEAVAADRWVIDGNYSMIRPTVWPRVETISLAGLSDASLLLADVDPHRSPVGAARASVERKSRAFVVALLLEKIADSLGDHKPPEEGARV